MLDTIAIPKPLLQAYERYGKWLPGLARLLFVVLLARALAELLWLLIPVPEAAYWKPAPVPQTSPSPGARRGLDAEPIVSAHLFGDYTAVPAITQMAAAPDTRLNLTLLGILSADAERESRALIGSSDGAEQPFAIGDDVVSGVNLQAIFPDRVILSRNGQLETLRLDKDSASPLQPGYDEEQAPVEESESGEQLSQIRQQLLADPSKASEFVRIQPANDGGQLRGYRIYPGRDRSIFAGAGLRPGDLVTSVNGIQLDDPSKALQMLTDLSRANNLSLVVERGGQQQTVNVNLN